MDVHELTLALALGLAGYLIGSIPFGLLIGRLFYGIDVRDYGSGNIGTTNTYRNLGFGAGALVLVWLHSGCRPGSRCWSPSPPSSATCAPSFCASEGARV
jgi:hypothetical protein